MNEVAYADIEEFIKDNYEPVEDKPGYVWLSKRNLQIIKIETLSESLKAYFIKSDGLRNVEIKTVTNAKEAEAYPINENMTKGFEGFTFVDTTESEE